MERRGAEDGRRPHAAGPARRRRSGPATRRRRRGGAGPRARSVAGPSPGHPQHGVGSVEAAKASRRTSRPLRGSWRPTKRMAGAAAGARAGQGSALAKRSTSTPLGRTWQAPPSQRSARARASGDTAVRSADAAGDGPHRRAEPDVGGDPAGGVERAHRRHVAGQQGGQRRAGHQRLVEVEDVGLARRPAPRACGGWPAGRGPAAPPTRWRPATRWARRRSPRVRAAARRRGRARWPRCPAARSVRARPRTCPCTPPGSDREYGQTRTTLMRLAPRPASAKSLGQLGWSRCHWSGARRMRTSNSAASAWVMRAMSSLIVPCRGRCRPAAG